MFKKEKTIHPLETDSVKVTAENAVDAVLALQKKKYPQHLVVKGFLILQHLDDKPLWNVTLLTRTFGALNVKIDAATGKVVRDEVITLFDLRAK